jgi:TolA-binding protein
MLQPATEPRIATLEGQVQELKTQLTALQREVKELKEDSQARFSSLERGTATQQANRRAIT